MDADSCCPERQWNFVTKTGRDGKREIKPLPFLSRRQRHREWENASVVLLLA